MLKYAIKRILPVCLIGLVASCSGEKDSGQNVLLDDLASPRLRQVAAVNDSNVMVSVVINGNQVASWRYTDNRSTISLPLEPYSGSDNDNQLVVSWTEQIGSQEILLEEYRGNFTVNAAGATVTPTGNNITSGERGGRFDQDGDGISNLDEREQNTDPFGNGDSVEPNTDGDDVQDNESESNQAAPGASVLSLQLRAPKTYRLNWSSTDNTDYYKVLENATGASGFVQIGADVQSGVTQYDHSVALHKRSSAQYLLQSCNLESCVNSNVVSVMGNQSAAVGYFKAPTSENNASFGASLSVSDDGNTIAVGAPGASPAGVVYVYFNNGSGWMQQARLETDSGDTSNFGRHVTLSGDGATLVSSDTLEGTGVVSIYTRSASIWSLQKRLQASNPGAGDLFGSDSDGSPLSLSYDGSMLAVGAPGEQSGASGFNGDQNDNTSDSSGAVYLFSRSGSQWIQTHYIKAPVNVTFGNFGESVSLDSDASTLAVGSDYDRDPDADGTRIGAVYVYSRNGANWSGPTRLKSNRDGFWDLYGHKVELSGNGEHLAVYAQQFGAESSTAAGEVHLYTKSGDQWNLINVLDPTDELDSFQFFGSSIAFSSDGQWLAIGEMGENSNSSGVGGDSSNNFAVDSGAVFLYRKSGSQWLLYRYLKATNTQSADHFGSSVAMSGNADLIVVGAPREDSAGTGLSANQADNSRSDSGAVYLY